MELLETSFRIHRDDWLSTYGRTAKIGFDPICYGTAVTAQQQVGRQRHNGIFHVSNVILTALTEFLRNLRNSNGMVETRHKSGIALLSVTILCHTKMCSVLAICDYFR